MKLTLSIVPYDAPVTRTGDHREQLEHLYTEFKQETGSWLASWIARNTYAGTIEIMLPHQNTLTKVQVAWLFARQDVTWMRVGSLLFLFLNW